MNDEYKICEEACKEWGCHCPPSHEFYQKMANTPAFIRAYFERKGYIKSMDDHNILHGEAAERFLENMKRTEAGEIDPKQKKFLEECGLLLKNMEKKDGKKI
jgi:hypothetical protein